MSDKDTVVVVVDRAALESMREILASKHRFAAGLLNEKGQATDIHAYDSGMTDFADDIAERGESLFNSIKLAEVWVLDYNAEGPEAGDYDGWQSVHASKPSAIRSLTAKLTEVDVDYAEMGLDADVISRAVADNGSEAADLLVNGNTKITYGLHRMPVEP